ncbi:MAG: tetratricopeptide repeat protein [Xanthomonadales bacterium]|nr:tetratricopeptide repeat protein [Xanthomonadales bacterium]
MAENKPFLTELLERRIPQILGMYIAAVWLAVEMADWMSERFDVPAQFSSYVFVIMISFLPLVALLGWGHGRPGKDKWTQKQIMFIPFNAILAYFAVVTFIKPFDQTVEQPAQQATEIMTLTDVQTGTAVKYEVAKSGMNQKVTGFFWENTTGDESLDWLSYGSMWMVAKDLMRNPVISIKTPYESGNMMRNIQSKGFDRAVGTPLSLNLDISSDRESQWMISGRILKDGSELTFEASLYDVLTGALVTTITSTNADWLIALDVVAEKLGQVILKQANISPSIIPDRPLSEHISDKLPAIKLMITALNAVNIDNDFNAGIEYLKQAVEKDQQLAEAYMLMVDFYRGIGDFEQAKAAAEAALRLDYKLSQESSLKIKANHYAITGDNAKAIKVLENWVKLSPESADALQALGANYLIVGNRLDDALNVYEKLSELQKTDTTALVNTARIYRLKDNYEKAKDALLLLKKQLPEKPGPLLELAATNIQFGYLAAARENYEEASLMSFDSISADLGLAQLAAYDGDIAGSLQALEDLMQKAQTDPAKVSVLEAKESILYLSGRLQEALEVVKQMRQYSASYLSPLQQTLMFGAKEASYLAYLQQDEDAWKRIEELKENTKPPFDQVINMVSINIYVLKDESERAAEALTGFMEFIKTHQWDFYNQFVLSTQAYLARTAGDYEAAIRLHDEAITESKQSFITLNSLAALDEMIYEKAATLFAQGEYGAIPKTLEDVLKRNPLHGRAWLLKAKALVELGQTEQAGQVLLKVKKLWSQADSQFSHLADLAELEAKINSVAVQ